MNEELLIRQALETRLSVMPNGITTAIENVTFTPISGTPHQAAFLLPADPINSTLGDTYYRANGIFRIRLCYPVDTGTGGAALQAQRIRDWFYRGLSLQQGGLDVIIQRTPSIGVASVIADRYTLTVDIRYFASILKV